MTSTGDGLDDDCDSATDDNVDDDDDSTAGDDLDDDDSTAGDDLDDDGAYVVQSVGWLMEGMKRGHVTISQSSTQCGHVDAVLHVPLKMVKSVPLLAVGDMVQVGGRKR
jgi:hypothetical protein